MHENTESAFMIRKYIKKSARELLFSDWINQILAFSIVFGIYSGIIQFGSALSVLADKMAANENVASL